MDGSNPAQPEDSPASDEALGVLNRELYFPTQVFFRDFEDKDSVNARLLKLLRAEKAEDAKGIERSNVASLGGWHSESIQTKPDYRWFIQRVIRTAEQIGEFSGYAEDRELVLDNMWAIINPRGSYNRSHIHPGSLWSGVYYIQAPEDAGRIVFTDPRTEHLMSHPWFKDGPRKADDWTEVYFQPIPGRMIMFPSWLYHSVEPNMTNIDGEEGERVIISFNLFQRLKP